MCHSGSYVDCKRETSKDLTLEYDISSRKSYLKASRPLAPKITAIFGDASEIANSYRNE